MNLSDMLSYADISQLSSIAEQYGCECNGHSKHELIQAILANAHQKEVINQSIDRLRLEELRFLNFLLFENLKAYSLEDLIALLQQCRFDMQPINALHRKEAVAQSATTRNQVKKRKKTVEATEVAAPREMIARFKSKGWLFNGYRGHERYMFHVPADFKLRFRQHLLGRLQKEASYVEAPANYEDESGKLLLDMSMMIEYITKNNPNAALDGVLHRRAVLQLNEASSIKEELPSKGAWKFGYGKGFGELPDRMTLIYDYLWSKRWILLQEDRIVVNATMIPNQIEASELKTVVIHWMKRYRTPIPNIRALMYWITMLSSSWCTLESIERVLLPFIKPYYFDSASQILHKRLVKPMQHFGLLQVSDDVESGRLLQATPVAKRLLSELYP